MKDQSAADQQLSMQMMMQTMLCIHRHCVLAIIVSNVGSQGVHALERHV